MADGSITIDSRVNNKGAYAELKELQAKAKSTAQQISGLDKQIGRLENKHTTLGEDLKQARQEAAATAREYYSLVKSLDANNSRGIKNDPADEKRADALFAQMEKQLSKVNGIAAEYRKQNAEIANLQQRHADLTGQISQEQEAANGAADALARQDAAADAAGRASKAMRRAANSVHNLVARLKAVPAQIKRASESMHHFCVRLKNIVLGALVFNTVSAALRTMVNGLGNAIAKTDGVNSALARLKGAASTAAAGLSSALAPAITWVLNLLTSLINGFVKLISLLTGKSVSGMKQAAKNMNGVGSAAGSAAKQVGKASRSLAGFDEVERLNAPQTGSSGGGGGSVTPNYDFASSGYGFVDNIIDVIKAGDWYQVGELVAQKLNESMAAIDWGPIDATAIRWATNLYNGLNGAVQNLNWGLLGSTIGNGLNTVLHFIDTFFQGFDWVTLGSGIGTGLNNLFATIDWAALGRVLSDKFMALLQTLHGFVQTFDWASLGLDVATMLSAALANIDWVQAAVDLGALAIGILTAINTALSQADWGPVGRNIMEMLAAIDWMSLIQQLVELLANTWPLVLTAILLPALGTWITGTLLPAIGEWITGTVIPAILQWLAGIVASIVSAIGLWPAILIAAIVALFAALVVVIVANWEDICDWFSGAWDNFVAGWNDFWDSVAVCAQKWWQSVTAEWTNFWNGIVDKFNTLKSGLSQAWDAFWTGLSDRVGDIWDGIVNTVKGAVNSLIGLINGMISSIVGGLNSVIWSMNNLHFDIPDWVPGLGGKSFGFDIGTLTAPQIPYLAQGAVIPANREFLAVLGDQTHGTNVEAPLATIQQAVAEVMEDVQAGQMAGFETLAELLRQLISAVYGIELTDEQVGRAAQRWQRHQEIMMGGAF